MFLDGGEVPEDRAPGDRGRARLPETVFVDDPERRRGCGSSRRRSSCPSPATRWSARRGCCASAGIEVPLLRPPAGEVAGALRRRAGHVAGQPGVGARRWSSCELDAPEAVDALTDRRRLRRVYVWAWIDEAAGTVRARVFVAEAGIDEDEATGSAALRLTARLDREIEIHQGKGSVLYARPLGDGRAEVARPGRAWTRCATTRWADADDDCAVRCHAVSFRRN